MQHNRRKEQWTTIIRPRTRWFDVDFKGVWQYRDLIWLLVKRYFTIFYRQTILGPAWIVIQPLLTTFFFTIIFGNIAELPTDGMPKFLFYMAGNILWHFFSNCLTTTSKTFIENRNLFGKVYFPRLCMPISTVFSEMINFFVQFAVFIIMLVYYALQPVPKVHPNFELILLTPFLLLQMGILGLGCGLIIAAITTKYRDLAMLVTFGVQLLMYATPVTYSSSMILTRVPHLYDLYMLNPVTPIIELFRAAYLGVQNYNPYYNLVSVGTTLLILAVGVVLFSRTDRTFMDIV